MKKYTKLLLTKLMLIWDTGPRKAKISISGKIDSCGRRRTCSRRVLSPPLLSEFTALGSSIKQTIFNMCCSTSVRPHCNCPNCCPPWRLIVYINCQICAACTARWWRIKATSVEKMNPMRLALKSIFFVCYLSGNSTQKEKRYTWVIRTVLLRCWL